MVRFLRLVLSIVVCHLAGVIGSVFTIPAVRNWYPTLVKPFFTPPGWVFSPVWLTLYTLMGIALYLVWEKGTRKFLIFRFEDRNAYEAINIFSAQLAANALWSIVFFGLRNILAGLVVLAALWLMIIITISRFYRVDRKAAWLLVPYIVWVTIALMLNLGVLVLNM